MKYYANLAGLTLIPESILKLVMDDWFDENDIRDIEKDLLDGQYIRIKGDDETARARAEILKKASKGKIKIKVMGGKK